MANRVDSKMVELGLAQSRERARALIIEGVVLLDGVRVMKPSDTIRDGQILSLKENPIPFVSRGGLKLQKAIDTYQISLKDRVCVDIGASTGGFTDCMLQNGAVKVYSIDVGHGQLAWKLRQDERVVCMEKTNIRYVTNEDIPDLIDFSSIDVSFISLTKVLGPVRNLLADNGQVVCLIKPQFEAGREKVGKKGVVRDKNVHIEVIEMVVEFAKSIGFNVLNLDFSPIKGPEGNIEYLLHIEKGENADIINKTDLDLINKIVEKAHDTLDK